MTKPEGQKPKTEGTHLMSVKPKKKNAKDSAAQRLRERYVRVVKIGDKWNAYLTIGVQFFSVVEQTSRERAQWFGRMLGIALGRLVEDEVNRRGAEGAETQPEGEGDGR